MRLSMRQGLAPLRRRDFRLFWAGFATTRLGRAVEDTGVVWLLYTLTESPVLLGVLGLVRAVPLIGLSPVAGALADRWDGRHTLMVTQTAGLLTSLALFGLVAAGLIEFWYLYIQVAVQASIEAFDGSTRLALYPRLVPRSELSEAVALNSTAGRSAQFVGPAVGGVAIATLGTAAPFLINAASFVGLLVAVGAMRPVASIVRAQVSTLQGDLVEGLRFILASRPMSGLLTLEVVVSLFQVNAVIITIVARDALGGGPVEVGLLLSAPALGALAAVIGLVVFGHSVRQGRLVLLYGVVYGAAMVAFGLGVSFPVAYLLLTVVGLADATMTVTRHSIMQLASPPEMRGRVMGNMAVVTRGVSPLADAQSGAIAGAAGPMVAAAVAGAALAAASIGTALSNRPLWEFRRTSAPEP